MKPISNYLGYSITNDGRVWSHKRNKWLKPYLHGGYFAIHLCNKGIDSVHFIHRLILETFVETCPIGMGCRHLNGIRIDNRLENLCWGTRQENIQDRDIVHKTGAHLKGEKHGCCKLTNFLIGLIRDFYNTELITQQELAKMFNIDQTHVSDIVNKKVWKHI